ncbi:hypothetical protein QTP88_003769 [Uroleucon formosanum]
MGQRDAAVRQNISQSVLGRILKNREDIEYEALQNESQSRKGKRCGKDDTVERALKEWFVKVKNKDARVSEALHFVNEAWNNISDLTIRNCFRHGGFVKTEEEEEEEGDHSKDLADKTYEDWMDIDRDLQTSEEYSKD